MTITLKNGRQLKNIVLINSGSMPLIRYSANGQKLRRIPLRWCDVEHITG